MIDEEEEKEDDDDDEVYCHYHYHYIIMIIIILIIIMIVYTYIDFCTARIFDTHLGTMSKCCLALHAQAKDSDFPKARNTFGKFQNIKLHRLYERKLHI